MPAASDGALPRTYRPLGARIVGLALTVTLVTVVSVGWFSFDAETRAEFNVFQLMTLTFLGLVYLALMFGLLRSRAEAHRDRLVVVNGYRRREYDWAQIIAVRLPPGAPWVTLDLADGETATVLGIQGSDGDRARRAVGELKALVASAGPDAP